eukprot:scaffold9510_cov58-Attheya_sp.AAC.3
MLESLQEELASLQLPSAASLVVAGQAGAARTTSMSTSNTTASTSAGVEDAWSKSLQQFTSTQFAQDFVQADQQKKNKVAAKTQDAGGDDYDVQEPLVSSDWTPQTFRPPPGIMSATTTTNTATTPAPPPQNQQQQQQQNQGMPPQQGMPYPNMVPPGMMSPNSMPSPGMQLRQQHPQQQQHHPGMPMMPPPGGMMMPPPPPPHMMMMMPPPPHMRMAPQPQPPQRMAPPPPQPKVTKVVPKKEPTPVFSADDFPSLGNDNKAPPAKPSTKETREEETKEAPPAEDKQVVVPPPPPPVERQSPQEEQQVRFIFNNPSKGAPAVSAVLVKSSCMPPRDLCFVIHSMLRPLLANTLDPLQDDYYHVCLEERTRASFGLGDRNTKKVEHRPLQTTENFEQIRATKAKDWMAKSHSLGHVVKTNIKRPRALLQTPVLARDNKGDDEGSEEVQEARVTVWKARASIDLGYRAYLELVDLQRLLRTASSGEERNQYLQQVPANVRDLQLCFGVMTDEGGQPVLKARPALQRVLGMAKGRLLLARALESGLLPHAAARVLLPPTLDTLLPMKPEGEHMDRLQSSLTGLVRTVQPSCTPTDSLACLDVLLSLSLSSSRNTNLKQSLGASRTLMEWVHAILARGGQLCSTNPTTQQEWNKKEAQFMQLLQQ